VTTISVARLLRLNEDQLFRPLWGILRMRWKLFGQSFGNFFLAYLFEIHRELVLPKTLR